MPINFKKSWFGINIKPKSGSTADSQGDLEVDSATTKLNYHNGTAMSPVVTETGTATLTNKTISASSNTISNIANVNIAAGAAIAKSKLASGTAYAIQVNNVSGVLTDQTVLTGNKAVVSDTNGLPVSSATSDTEIGYVAGVTSAIQTQLNGKQASGSYITALTGDVVATGPGSVSGTIQANVVSNAKLAQMATHTIKGNATGGTADPSDLTGTQTTALLDSYVVDSGSGGTKGLVPAPAAGDAAANKFLKAGSSWTAIAAGDVPTLNQNTTGTASNVTGVVAVANGGTGQSALTSHYVLVGNNTTAITQVSPSTAGFVLTSNGASSDPSFQAPPTSSIRAINAQTGTTYTFALTDGSNNGNNPLVTFSNASAQTVTVPLNAIVAFPIGTQIDCMQEGAGKVTFVGSIGVTLNSSGGNLSIGAQYVGVSLIKTATNVWTIVGYLIA